MNQRKKAEDSAAKADVSTLAKELAVYFVDYCMPPVLSINTSGRYQLAAPVATSPCTTPTVASTTDLGRASDHVTIKAQIIVDVTHWCVGVENLQGDKQTHKYSAKNGLAQGECTRADVE